MANGPPNTQTSTIQSAFRERFAFPSIFSRVDRFQNRLADSEDVPSAKDFSESFPYSLAQRLLPREQTEVEADHNWLKKGPPSSRTSWPGKCCGRVFPGRMTLSIRANPEHATALPRRVLDSWEIA